MLISRRKAMAALTGSVAPIRASSTQSLAVGYSHGGVEPIGGYSSKVANEMARLLNKSAIKLSMPFRYRAI